MRTTSRRAVVLALALAVPSLLRAQEPTPAPSPSEAPKAKPASAPAREPAREDYSQPGPARAWNVRIELTLTDRSGTNLPVVKSATLTLADHARGSVRSLSQVQSGATVDQPRELPLDVDARPRIDGGGKVGLELTVDYRSIDLSDKESKFYPSAGLRFSGNIFLENGKPTLVAQAADPVSDRRITLEAKATILR